MTLTFSVPRLLVQCNFATVVTCTLLITFILSNVSFTKRVNSTFLGICVCTLLLTVSDDCRFITAHQDTPTLLRYIAAATGYTLRPLIIFLLALLTGRNSTRKLHFWNYLIIAFNGIIAFASCIPKFHGLMFDYNAQNAFIRGPFGVLPYICCAYYLLLILHFIIRKNVMIKSEIIIILVIMLLGSIATAMESLYKYDLILSQVLIIGTVFYYLFFNVQIYKRDTLTQFENRRCFYLELDKIDHKQFCIISMDLNNLKTYNDTQGHAAGDLAITTSTGIMLKSFPKRCKLYRTGGDEFMAICRGYTLEETNQILSDFQKNLSETIYQVACGAAEYHPGDDVEEVIAKSDKLMYENKALLKSK